jgi:beta-lactamase regulating signal transducer with metallopeptidase domain
MSGLILDHLWQSTLFAGLAGLVVLALRRNGARLRHAIWFAASLKFLIPFAVLTQAGGWLALLLPQMSAPPVLALQSVAQPFSLETLTFAAAPQPGPDWKQFIMPVMLALWGIGAAAILGRWLLRWSRLQRVLRTAEDCALAAPVPVKMARSLLEPGLVGIWKPVILLPQGITERLSQAEMDAVLAHEICHLRRRDNLLAATHMLVEAIFWFHPLIWWLGARLNAERELACDESVLAAGLAPQVYAQSILKVCQLYLHSPLDCAAGISGADLKRRMETIMNNKFAIRLNSLKKGLLATCAAATIVAPLALGALTAPLTVAPAMAQAAGTPHPGTEAAVRHQIESMVKGQADFDVMVPSLAQAARAQSERSQANIQKWGAFKSITFRGNDNGNDVYSVQFENQLTTWTIGPVRPDGKIGPTLFFGPAIKRDGNGPSPGLAAAIRRELDGNFAGKPALEIMSPELQTATQQQWKRISESAKDLGAVQAVTFQEVNARGWDVYRATFANGTATVLAVPLTDGKLSGLLHTEILTRGQPNPGTEASLRRYIESIQRGQPNYDEMGPQLAQAVRNQLADTQARIQPLGALKSITFKGKGPMSMDVYDVAFDRGRAEWSVGPLTADGKVERRGYRVIN